MNKISPKPKVGDYVKILPGATTTTGINYCDKIVKVVSVHCKDKNPSKWFIGVDVPDDGGLWFREFIIVSNISKSQKQHLLDLIKSI